MVAILKSASSTYYQSLGLNPDWVGKIEVIDSKLLTHQDFASATHFHWVAGSTLFQLTFPHVTDNNEGVVGYWNRRGDSCQGRSHTQLGLIQV